MESKDQSNLDLGMGAYLTFTAASAGTLFLNWSHEPVEGALAYFRPQKNVPKFKFKKNGGRSEILRDCAMMKIKRHYSGWCQFVKLAKSFQGEIVILSEDLRVHVNHAGPVVELTRGQFFSLDEAVAVSVLNRANDAFSVQTMIKSLFIEVGNQHGAALDLQ